MVKTENTDSMLLRAVKKIIPENLKLKIKLTKFYLSLEANKLASTSKRLDICAAQIAHLLHLIKLDSLKGKICLEVGSGWTLSHSIICYLLGAKKIYATDIFPIAFPKSLYKAIHKSVISLIRDILSPFESHHLLRERLNHLLSIPHFDFKVLKELGIEYIAPIDFAKTNLNSPVDFIFSNSVFELIPKDDLDAVLKNLVEDLKPDGLMVHLIHLEDHKDIPKKPFDFLSIPSSDYSRIHESKRGNRLRKSDWQKIFIKLSKSNSSFIYEWSRKDIKIPQNIDRSIHYQDESDLRVSHIGVLTKKLSSFKI